MTEDKQTLLGLLDRFPHCRVAVIGDLMIDSYVWGKVERISPEAPVPVVQVQKTTCCLGGAANVMRNVVTLGGTVDAFGVAGVDENGKRLKAMLGEYNISAANLLPDSERPTICKERIIAGSQQLLRIDHEDPAPLQEELREALLDTLCAHLTSGSVQALVLEDYAKGLFSADFAQKLLDCASHCHVPAILDPNPRNPMRLRGISVMKPNRNEAFALAGKPVTEPAGDPAKDAALREVANVIQNEWEVEHLLISLAAQGMALFERDGSCTVIPTRAREVYDVSGAGDTVIAAATLTMAVGGSAICAAELANHAAGIVVRQLGTATVSADEVRQSIQES